MTKDESLLLKSKTEIAIDDIIDAFAVKQDLEFQGFVSDDIFGIADFGGTYFFNISDIYHDLISNQPKGLIVEWLDDCLDNQEQTINYRSYCMGLRFKDIEKSH